MSIDVIIPVYKPTEKFKKTLEKISEQTCKIAHIFLLHTQDGIDLNFAKELCGGIPLIEVPIEKEEFDHGGTRDKGMKMSEADIVIMMTQDAVLLKDDTFYHLIKRLEGDSQIAVSYARQVPGDGCGIIEQYTRKFNYPEESMLKSKAHLSQLGIKTYFCSNVCAAYRKDIYMELDGFEKKIIFNEDMVFAAKAIGKGYKIAYEADAAIVHSHDYTGMQQLKRNFDLGVSQACYPEIFGEVKSEGEGLRLVKETAKYLMKEGQFLATLELIWKSGCKYIGYQFGKNYVRLPKSLVRKLTMNPVYWREEK